MFEKNKEIRRSDIHDYYGGNRQSGISWSGSFPYIFIFTGKRGTQYGYEDGWLNRIVFYYTGEGSKGDMDFVRGNIQLRDHLQLKKRVFLFEAKRKGYVTFVDELELFDIDFFNTLDSKGETRNAIKFFFKRLSEEIKYQYTVSNNLLSPNLYEYTPTINQPALTERAGFVTSRVGQGAYRKSIIHRWENKCAVTGYNNKKILIASHILAWKDASHAQRLDVENGILLSPVYDALFDRKLISFGDEGGILLSKELKSTNYEKLGVSGFEKIGGLRGRNFDYLTEHRKLANI